MQQQTSPKTLPADKIEKLALMEAIVSSEAGIAFCQWLCGLCGWSKSTATDVESARRDIWILIRKHIPIEKLHRIEYEDLRVLQAQDKAFMAEMERQLELQQTAKAEEQQ